MNDYYPLLAKVQAYDWRVKEYVDRTEIHCWALDKDSNPYLIRVQNFPIFAQIELPLNVGTRRNFNWSRYKDDLIKHLQSCLGDNGPVDADYNKLKKLYYFNGDTKFPMLCVYFPTLQAMRRCAWLLREPLKLPPHFPTIGNQHVQCFMWEHNIDMVRKLLTLQEVRYAQWFSIECRPVDDERISTIKHEYIAKWQSMEKISEAECSSWSTKPGVLSFDIECYSHNKRAMPDRYDDRDVAFMISAVYQRYQRPDTLKRYGIVIGDCNQIDPSKLQACELFHIDPFDPKLNPEEALINTYSKVVQATDPEVVTGYNILSFDYPYLDHRIGRLLKKWPVVGRLTNVTATMDTRTWESAAYGYQSIYNLQMDGRISVDMLPIIKRDHKLEKYDLNTVCRHFIRKEKHDVSPQQMFATYEATIQSGGKMRALEELGITVKDEGIFDPNEDIIRNRTQLDEEAADDDGVSIIQGNLNEVELVYDIRQICEELTTDKVISLRDINIIKARYKKAVRSMTEVMSYCIQDAELVIHLMTKLKTWEGLIEFSSIMGVTITALFTRGQQVRCLSQIYDLAARRGYVINARPIEKTSYAGGFVFNPIPGLYENIICLDFASLYPSIMQAYNICYTTLIPEHLWHLYPDGHPDINDMEFEEEEKLITTTGVLEEGPACIEIVKATDKVEDALTETTTNTGNAKKTVMRKYKYKWYKRVEGIVPMLVKNLVEERRGVRRQQIGIKKTDPDKWQRLEAKQLGLKVSANSLYGFFGAQNGYLPLPEGGRSVTAMGRMLIGIVNTKCAQKYGGRVVAGDTDSSMFDLGITDRSKCNEMGIRLTHDINGVKKTIFNEKGEHIGGDIGPDGKTPYLEDIPGWFPPPLKMEFEKAMRLLVFKKKKYAALLIDKKGNFKCKEIYDENGDLVGYSDEYMILKRGIVIARRDNTKFLTNTYTKILNLVLDRRPFLEALEILVNRIHALLTGKIPPEELVSIRQLNSNYKRPNAYMKLFADNLRRDGKQVTPGDRLDFVIVKKPGETLLGNRLRLLEQYYQNIKDGVPEELDYIYYLEHGFQNPIDQLIGTGYQELISKTVKDIWCRLPGRRNPTTLEKPVEFIMDWMACGYPADTLIPHLRTYLSQKGLN